MKVDQLITLLKTFPDNSEVKIKVSTSRDDLEFLFVGVYMDGPELVIMGSEAAPAQFDDNLRRQIGDKLQRDPFEGMTTKSCENCREAYLTEVDNTKCPECGGEL